jgi:SET domain-containing protein
MPASSGIRVIRSPIHGYGVVATRDFSKGDVIVEVDGVLWQEDDPVDDRYSLWIDDGVYLDMVDQTRWINHSCDPNGEIEAELDGQGGAWARVVALRPIQSGQEITYDYGFLAEQAEPCACGSPLCRGFIVDQEERHKLPKKRVKRGNRLAK